MECSAPLGLLRCNTISHPPRLLTNEKKREPNPNADDNSYLNHSRSLSLTLSQRRILTLSRSQSPTQSLSRTISLPATPALALALILNIPEPGAEPNPSGKGKGKEGKEEESRVGTPLTWKGIDQRAAHLASQADGLPSKGKLPHIPEKQAGAPPFSCEQYQAVVLEQQAKRASN